MKNVSEEYTTLSERIRSASSQSMLRRHETTASRIYSAGLLTPSQLARLDDMILRRLISFEDSKP